MNSINIHCFLAARASLCCRAGGNGLLETSHQTLDSGVTDSRVSVSAARTMAMVSVCCPVSLLTGMARRLYHLLAPSSPLGLIKSLVHTHSLPKQQSIHTNSGGGGGGFFLAGEDFGRMSDHPFPTCACLLSLFRFVFVFALGSGD